MAGAERAVAQQLADAVGQGEQAQGVGDVAAAFADGLAQRVLGQREFVDEAAVAFRLLQGVEVLALEVLDQGGGHGLAVAEIADHDRDLVQRHELGGAPAALAADDLVEAAVAAGLGADQDRLQHAVLADGIGELLKGRGLHGAARLEGAGFQHLDRQGADGAVRCCAAAALRRRAGRRRRGFAEQGGEAAAEPWGLAGRGAHAAGVRVTAGLLSRDERRSRRRSSAASFT